MNPKTIEFPVGLPGFEDLHEFKIYPVEGTKDLLWLQSEESPEVALLAVYPFHFFKDYDIDIPDEEIKELAIEDTSETLLLNIVTIPEGNPAGATANLVAPVVINTRLKKAKQVILSGTKYTTKHKLFPENIEEKAAGGEGS